jgi:hypothetical protein
MSRLTKTYSDGTHGASDSLPCGENSYDYKNLLIDKLGEYEDLEEQCRLVILPCKVGDTLYLVNKGAKKPVIMMRVLQLYIKQLHKDRTVIRIDAINDDDMGESCYFLENIGKTVFLTKSEAEAKLKELR